IRGGISVAVESAVIAVKAEVDIEPAVAVVVGERRSGKGPLRLLGEPEGFRHQAEPTVPLVQKKQRPSIGYNDKVLVAVVVQVGEQRARAAAQNTNTRRFGHVLECAIAAVPVKPVGKARWLADVEVVKPVVVDVSDGHAIIAVNVHA